MGWLALQDNTSGSDNIAIGVEQQQKEIDALKTELKEQRALIEKVNDKMELTASASQTIANNQ